MAQRAAITAAKYGLPFLANALFQSRVGTTEDPPAYEPPEMPAPSSSQTPHTPAPQPNPNAGLATDTYRREQYAINSTGTPFMSYGMWRGGAAVAPHLPDEVLKPIVDNASAPCNEDAPKNRATASAAVATAGALTQKIPHPLTRILGTGMQMLGSANLGGELVAQHQAANTPVVDDPGLTDDLDQIKADYQAIPKQYAEEGYKPQAKVVGLLEPNKKNASGSSAIQRKLLPHKTPLFRKSDAASSDSSSSTPAAAVLQPEKDE